MMVSKDTSRSGRKPADIVAEARRDQAAREKTYREQALRLFPHVCARCGREFSGRRLRELTVHHKDSDHMNNPPDGSNWELLCLFCHDYEHQDGAFSGYSGSGSVSGDDSSMGHNPFAGLANLIKPEQHDEEE